MECKQSTFILGKGCDQMIKEKHFNPDEILPESKNNHLQQNETYSKECVWSSHVAAKIGIKQEIWDPTAVMRDFISDSPTSDFVELTGAGSIKDDEIDTKEKHLNQDQVSSESLQNGTPFVECDESCDMDTKIGIKQESWDPNVLSNDTRSTPKKPPISIMKGGDEVYIKEEPWWFDGTSTESQNEEKGSESDKHEACKDTDSLDSRLPTKAVCTDEHQINILDEKKDGKTVCDMNASEGASIKQNISSLNDNPICVSDHFELEQYMGDVGPSVCKCGICKKCYAYRSSLNDHTLSESGIKQYECEDREMCLTQKSTLQTHIFLHADLKPYKYEHCEKNFTHMSKLQRHALLHSGTKPFKCDICGKHFTAKSSLKQHERFHSGIKPYKCKYCQKCFTKKSHLQSHTLIHSDSNPYKCEKCQKCFTRNSDLQRHILRHSGTKPYQCDICEMCFTQKSTLKSHTFLHSGTKPYKCEICEKYYTRKFSLKNHKLLHTGTKPYKCEICDKCYTQKSHLRRHSLLHSDTKA